jgi:hypothetical protein
MMRLTVWVRWLLVLLLFLLPELQTQLRVLFYSETFFPPSVWKLVSDDPITVRSRSNRMCGSLDGLLTSNK